MLQLSGKLSLVDSTSLPITMTCEGTNFQQRLKFAVDSVTQLSLQMSWDHGEAHGHLAVVDALVQSDAFVGIPLSALGARWLDSLGASTKSLKSHKLVDTCADKAMEGINIVKGDKRAWDQISRTISCSTMACHAKANYYIYISTKWLPIPYTIQ